MKTVVLLSGGIDSLTLAEHEWRAGRLVGTVFVGLGQPAETEEYISAKWFSAKTQVPHKICDIKGLDLGDMENLKGASVVPSRNLILLSIASNLAVSLGGEQLLIGANSNDQRDYVDCRESALVAASKAFVEMGGLPISAPFANVEKSQIVQLARQYGLEKDNAWSCYRSGTKPCGFCASCKEAELAWSAGK